MKRNISSKNRIVIKNTLFAFLIKGAALIVSLFSTPAFVRYFNNNAALGVWYTMLSMLMWFLNFDLGIGNGIRNNLVMDFTKNDYVSARRTISSGFFSVGIVTICLTAVGFAAVSVIDLNSLYNIGENVISDKTLLIATSVVLFGIMLRFFLASISSVFYALQMSSINNFLALCVSLLQLTFVVTVKPSNAEQGLLWLSVAYVVLSNVPVIIAGIVVFATKLKMCRPSLRYIDKNHIYKVIDVGVVFFVCQIAYMLIMNTNEFLISNLFGPQFTTEYTFYHKLTTLVSMVVTLAMTPIWSVVTKAMAEQDYAWLSKLYKTVKILGAATIVLQFGLVLVQQFIMDLWLREASIQIDYVTAIAFACFGSVFVYSSVLSTIVCGMARMRLQMIYYVGGVLLKMTVVYILAPIINDWSIVVWSNVLVLFPYCIVQQVDLDRYIQMLRDTKTKQDYS